MAKKPVSPVQLALQVTFFLKGDLKRERKLFILIASKLARIRDEQMWKALKLRRQALRGTLTDKEFRALRKKIRPTVAPLRGTLRRIASLREEADQIEGFPAAARKAVEEAIRAIEEALGSTQHVAKLLSPPAIALARAELAGDSAIV